MNNGLCDKQKPLPENCQSGWDGQCEECKKGFELTNNNTCVKVVVPPNCVDWEDN